jgi:tetrahydromethanopterin S-methyltransferase subunit H
MEVFASFKFCAKQQKFKIGKVNIGGFPGKRPTVLVGTIFYSGQKIFRNEESLDFDRKRAEDLINKQDEFSEKTGNPCMIDVVGAQPKTFSKLLDFVEKITDSPILIDGTTSEVRIAGLEYAAEVGLIDKVVYNSLAPRYMHEELEKIKDIGIKSAILLAYNLRDMSTLGRINTIKDLLKVANQIGIDKPLIDTWVLDVPSLGIACEAVNELKNELGLVVIACETVNELKNELGLVVGCGAHNAVSTWRGLKTKMGDTAIKPSIASACVLSIAAGADFVLYGPIEDAKYVFPVIAMADAAYANLLMEKGEKIDQKHPLFRIA